MEKVCGIGMTAPTNHAILWTHIYGEPVQLLSFLSCTVYATALNGRSVRIQNTSIGIYKRNIAAIDVLSEEEGELKGKSNYGQIQGSGLMSYAVLVGRSYS